MSLLASIIFCAGALSVDKLQMRSAAAIGERKYAEKCRQEETQRQINIGLRNKWNAENKVMVPIPVGIKGDPTGYRFNYEHKPERWGYVVLVASEVEKVGGFSATIRNSLTGAEIRKVGQLYIPIFPEDYNSPIPHLGKYSHLKPKNILQVSSCEEYSNGLRGFVDGETGCEWYLDNAPFAYSYTDVCRNELINKAPRGFSPYSRWGGLDGTLPY